MLSVSEFMQSLNKNQLFIKIVIQIDDYIELEYPSGCHVIFNNNSVKLTNCKILPKNYIIIIEGKTETGYEVKLFWGEKHFELLKDTAPCIETEFEILKHQLKTERCININKLHTVFLIVCKKEATKLVDDKLKD